MLCLGFSEVVQDARFWGALPTILFDADALRGSPVFRVQELANPNAALVILRVILFIAIVAHPRKFMADSHARYHLCGSDIGSCTASAFCQRPSIAVRDFMFTDQTVLAQQFFQIGARCLAAFPCLAQGVGTGLSVFGRIDALQTKSFAADFKAVAIFDPQRLARCDQRFAAARPFI
jgi:hypothetical protein